MQVSYLSQVFFHSLIAIKFSEIDSKKYILIQNFDSESTTLKNPKLPKTFS